MIVVSNKNLYKEDNIGLVPPFLKKDIRYKPNIQMVINNEAKSLFGTNVIPANTPRMVDKDKIVETELHYNYIKDTPLSSTERFGYEFSAGQEKYQNDLKRLRDLKEWQGIPEEGKLHVGSGINRVAVTPANQEQPSLPRPENIPRNPFGTGGLRIPSFGNLFRTPAVPNRGTFNPTVNNITALEPVPMDIDQPSVLPNTSPVSPRWRPSSSGIPVPGFIPRTSGTPLPFPFPNPSNFGSPAPLSYRFGPPGLTTRPTPNIPTSPPPYSSTTRKRKVPKKPYEARKKIRNSSPPPPYL